MVVHLPVLLNEAIDALAIKTDGVYVDGTFGYGGHSRLILSRLGKKGRLIAFDKDLAAIKAAAMIDDKRFSIRHCSYVKIQNELLALRVERVDGVLLDLGVSSSQLDESTRGFSFRLEGPLDMRMDTSCGQTAAEWLNSVTESQLEEVIRNYGEERNAKQIARAIVMARARHPISSTIQLAEIVAAVVRARGYQREGKHHPATRTFQAIRIYLNQELEELLLTLPQCVDLLNPGGRLVAISFHSLEDRIVKRFMRTEASSDRLPHKLPLRDREVKALSKQRLRLVGKATRPGAQEIAVNPRARSAVMRVAERIIISE
ncbi:MULTISPECIES: 16S rRNA (cytosine(1402)-N(4))-methyltransferase RsmH [Nitrosomonas]|uniref:Ribosomal RNA small subunit methyltransferase H n=1 Tax=Nitrosomonas communis TaxID=44574 RepID=A0A0F7KDS3_9PROT|nr:MULTISPECIES: 16S rRNA (cytosine(1402)-N(4))-methyltransferase RsmH [Nitrosomonas]AKH37676.1 16S rRNA methyltransferase [Nitrosomonas communis]TYP83873.1 16S rRNA (cytosine1402-N4)-methyltransferase [Nitrosomonas communis]UVS62978.1 16S rRNA (cytosine(1402)-N(4))-methyltransferase RsmH [Nitrosomonas sp. PLL12]